MGNKKSETVTKKQELTTQKVILNPDLKIAQKKKLSTKSTYHFLLESFVMQLEKWEKDLTHIKSKDYDRFMPEVTEVIEKFHKDCKKITNNLSDSLANYYKLSYRNLLNDYWKQGKVTKRVIEKPNGYDGDYLTMELMYADKYEGTTKLGKMLHKYVVNDRSSISVRMRREYFVNKIKGLVDKKNNVTIMSVASGPATEIYELIRREIYPKKIILIDMDKNALKFATSRIKPILPKFVELIPLNINIYSFVRFRNKFTSIKDIDYIYSAGLFDYLSDIMVRRLTSVLAKSLNNGGEIEVGCFSEFPIGFFADIAADWNLITRSVDELKELGPKGYEMSTFNIKDQGFLSIKNSI
ncbi:MAG: hypothetical protein A2Y40_03950 [Candidatus Margulisbacteria bacterium GWF2_35_9]|nr:MAG: hypothetical protein A2Y40_03950 [Candidatus Margulisbacteria bacterium GWF2_35_9]